MKLKRESGAKRRENYGEVISFEKRKKLDLVEREKNSKLAKSGEKNRERKKRENRV